MKTIDRHLWQRFWITATPYWRGEEKWKAWGLVVLLVVFLLGLTRFAVLFNAQTGEFTSALAARDEARFWEAIRECLVLVAVAVPLYALYYYVRDTLGLHWRRWLTNRFLASYFSDRNFYELNAVMVIDNPDQRIAEDINTFTQRSLYFLLIFIGSILQLVAFSAVLWSISRVLVYFLVVYTVAGTLVTVLVFGRVMIRINFQQLRREADFRFSLVRVRENAESIAFYRGEAQELVQVTRRFTGAFDNFNLLITRQLFLNLFQYGYVMITIVLPSAIMASQVLSGELEVGAAVQAAGAFAAILTAMSMIVDNFESLSRFAAGVDRLYGFSQALAERPAGPAPAGGIIESVEDSRLALEDVTLLTPNRERILVQKLSLDILPGQSLMIVGESGCGKSSLLRAIAGLWYAGCGRIIRPGRDEILFLPQKPYMQIGTLRSQLLYPKQGRAIQDAELLGLLARVNLPDLAERFDGLDVDVDWEKVLSVGEQQRLAFARVLLIRPRYAILDEASSALDSANEEALYRQLAASGTTMVSVAHRATILKFHQQVLELTGDGGWQCHPAEGYRFT
jgi:vitamin B12/bleomycin/antimicrobial peptide transport system ATP-binding/permease protein